MNDSGVRLLGRLRGHHTAVLRRGRARVPPASGSQDRFGCGGWWVGSLAIPCP